MSYIVYHIESTRILKIFNKESSAKRSVTCANRNAGITAYAYAEKDFYYRRIVYKKTVKSLLSGKDVVIDSNTPISCDPSSETYWSM